jgi:hypothetical protein
MTEQPKTDQEQPKTDQERIAELERRLAALAALEKYIQQLRQHGHLPTMRDDQ